MADNKPDKLIKVSESTRIHLFCIITSIVFGVWASLLIFHRFSWFVMLGTFLVINLLVRKTKLGQEVALRKVPEELKRDTSCTNSIGPGSSSFSHRPSGYDYPHPQSTLSLARSTSGNYY